MRDFRIVQEKIALSDKKIISPKKSVRGKPKTIFQHVYYERDDFKRLSQPLLKTLLLDGSIFL